MPDDALLSMLYAIGVLLLTMAIRYLTRWLDLLNTRQLQPKAFWPFSLFQTSTIPEFMEKVRPVVHDRTFMLPTIAALPLEEVWMRDRRDKTYDEWLAEPPRWSLIPSRSPQDAQPHYVIAVPEPPPPPPNRVFREDAIPPALPPAIEHSDILRDALNQAHKLIAQQQVELDQLHRERDFWKHRTLKKRGKHA